MKIRKKKEGLKPSSNGHYFFLSGWIANLGVVPLFFIAFLRFWPIDLALACLLLVVTLVLDTIRSLLNNNSKISPILYFPSYLVKAIPAFSLSLALILGINFRVFAQNETKNTTKDLILAKGEQTELAVQGLSKFSIGNKEILGHKHIPAKGQFLIKGKSVGFSDLVIWDNQKNKHSYKVFVISKNDQLKTIHTADALKYLNLNFKIQGENIYLEGDIQDIDAYLMLLKITKEQKNLLTSHLELSATLKSQIVGEIYSHFLKEGIQEYSCKVQGIKINCSYDELTPPSPEVQKLLSQKYDVILLPYKSHRHRQNFKIKLKMLQLERLDGREMSFGLYRLESNVHDLFSLGVQDLINRNQIFIQENSLHVSTLAEPESIIMLNHENTIEIGQEIPFRADTQFAQNIQWKFAGIKIKLKLNQCGEFYCLEYETEFTTPRDGGINGSKNKSKLIINPGKPIQFFQVSFKTISDDSKGLPILSHIPLLGELFKSKSKQETFKTISGYLSLSVEDEHGEF